MPEGQNAGPAEYPVYSEAAYEVSDYFGRPSREQVAQLVDHVFKSKLVTQAIEAARGSWITLRSRSEYLL
jgi:hypothetical protein